MQKKNFDTIIIGTGQAGASTAYHLAKRGHTNILLLEQAADLHFANSARSGRGFRHQWSSEINIKLSKWGIAAMGRSKEELGVDAELDFSGYIFLVDNPAHWESFQEDAKLQAKHGFPPQLLSPTEAKKILPELNTNGLIGAAYSDKDGLCNPMNVRRGYLDKAIHLGAEMHFNQKVVGIEKQANNTFSIQTKTTRYDCQHIVNACGAWSPTISAMLGLKNPAQHFRRQLFVMDDMHHGKFSLPFIIDVGSGFYMRSHQKDAWIGTINPNEPPKHTQEVDFDWFPNVIANGQKRFPYLKKGNLNKGKCWAGTYAMTPDNMPVLGRHPQELNFIDINGFSGRGIMHSPACGMLIAEEILDGRAYTINIDELRINRFNNKNSLKKQKIF